MNEERGRKRPREAGDVINETNEEAIDLKAQQMAAAALQDDDDDAPVISNYKLGQAVRKGHECPYLDTISRQVSLRSFRYIDASRTTAFAFGPSLTGPDLSLLSHNSSSHPHGSPSQNLDFDFEKCCSVSLTHVNVYVCLVCGKYFQGRGPGTHAYTHSLEEGHHLFMKLDSGRVYCLPDMYEVVDRSLSDIQYVLNPTFPEADVKSGAVGTGWARALDGSEYMPGLVGLNNMKANDYANVVIQAMLRITPLRDFFLRPENYAHCSAPLVRRFGELVRKMCNPRAFKGHVSPHEFMQSVMAASGKRFLIDRQADPVELFSWLANTLHADLTGGKRKRRSIITDCLQGELEVKTEAGTGKAKDSAQEIVERVPFLMLTLDLPPAPLFKDSLEKVIIPQIPVFELLRKFDGASVQEDVRAGRRCLRITRLPRYLVLHVKRFVRNQFFIEKNPTIVNFPVRDLNLAACIPVPEGTPEGGAKYDLVANIVHEGKAGEGAYRVHIQRTGEKESVWYEVQDLAMADVLPQQVVLSEAYLQVYQLKDGSSSGAKQNNGAA